jgi:hypothetical protein
MARPLKQGLDFIYMNVDETEEEETLILESENPATAYAVYHVIRQLIGKGHGYYIHDDNRLRIKINQRISVDINTVNDIINRSLGHHLFSICHHQQYNILTSKKIQEDYFHVTYKRKSVEYCNAYIMKGVNVGTKAIDVDINGVNDDINSHRIEENRIEENTSEVKPTPKTSIKATPFSETDYQLRASHDLFELMRRNNNTHKEPNWQSWAQTIDKIVRIDKQSKQQLHRVLVFSQHDAFWKQTCHSAENLRKNFIKIHGKAKGWTVNAKTNEVYKTPPNEDEFGNHAQC